MPALIHIYPAPVVPVIAFSNDTLYCTATSNSYQWYLNNIIIPGVIDSFFVFSVPGSYHVVITDSNGCSAQSNSFTIVGVDEINADFHLNIFPNPVKSVFSITSVFPSMENIEIRLFDGLDREVYFSKHENVK